jgi:PPOX class probable F420-dependent enzyme
LLTRSEAISRARSGVVGRMATVTPEGKPHVVPFVFVLLGDERHLRAYWAVDQKPKKAGRIKRIENLKANPALEFVVDGYEEDWDLLWWVRVSGTARMVDSDVERAQAIAALAKKYPQYVQAPPGGPVIAVDVQAISSWEATEGPSDPGL